ncbi:MAG: CocE/NonD family hydrolase C-terminal non-catalytic domain-containing protein [Gemmatimonadales bacterium]
MIDVYPDVYEPIPRWGGYQLMVANDVFRPASGRASEEPSPVVSNQVNAYQIDLHAADYTFKRGHRIMVQVQSTWFPLIDRNPQRYVPNIFKAKDSDYVTAIQRVFRSGRYPSNVEVSVVVGR